MAKTYTTIQGETWDEIAYKVYGGEEYAAFLMANNYRYLDILVFSAGTVLNTPGIPWYEDSDELPPWRTGAEDEDEDEDPYDDYSNEDEAEDDE
ncbi:phage tail protein [bacterium 1XD42-94]|nr:phage tail protein [bacterium 1XD42-76]NBK05054.1 phage tail protein [bacterium 1XD42-94]